MWAEVVPRTWNHPLHFTRERVRRREGYGAHSLSSTFWSDEDLQYLFQFLTYKRQVIVFPFSQASVLLMAVGEKPVAPCAGCVCSGCWFPQADTCPDLGCMGYRGWPQTLSSLIPSGTRAGGPWSLHGRIWAAAIGIFLLQPTVKKMACGLRQSSLEQKWWPPGCWRSSPPEKKSKPANVLSHLTPHPSASDSAVFPSSSCISSVLSVLKSGMISVPDEWTSTTLVAEVPRLSLLC